MNSLIYHFWFFPLTKCCCGLIKSYYWVGRYSNLSIVFLLFYVLGKLRIRKRSDFSQSHHF